MVGNSVASAGAGQLALALMGRRALAAQAKAPPAPEAPATAVPSVSITQPAQPAPATLPAAAVGAGFRKASHGGGYVTSLFRDAANELDEYEEDEWRMGVRDAEASGVDVYDLDDIAA